MKSRTLLSASGIGLPAALCGALGGYLAATHGYAVDWPATGAMLQGEAAILGACAALWGVNQWRKELRYKRNSDLAVKALTAAIGLEQSLKIARRPTMEWEIDRAFERGRVLKLFSYESRLKALKDPDHSSELGALLNQVAAIFGPSHRDAIDALLMTHTLVISALEQSIVLRRSIDTPNPMGNSSETIEALSYSLFPKDSGEDHLGEGIEVAAERIRELFQKSM